MIAKVAPPLVIDGVAVKVYIKSTPAIVNVSPAWGVPVMPSTSKLVPVCEPAFTNTVP